MFLDDYPILDESFATHVIEPLMPVNPLWRNPLSEHVDEVGMLIETHVIACTPSMMPLSRVWWPLTAACMSRNLNVSLIK